MPKGRKKTYKSLPKEVKNLLCTEDYQLLARAFYCTPGGSQANSKRHGHVIDRTSPAYAMRGEGPYIELSNKRRLIDLAGANGAVPLGYADPQVECNVRSLAQGQGGSLSLPSPLEIAASEAMIKNLTDSMSGNHMITNPLVRWVRTGSEAVSAAVAIAQEETKRIDVGCLEGSYHGWHPWTRQAKTLPEFSWFKKAKTDNVIELLRREDVAVVLIESPRFDPVDDSYRKALAVIREACNATKTLLAFDDVVFGFRFAEGGLTQVSKVKPDLICFAKALGNGYPIGCVVGRGALMDKHKYRVSSTFGGEMTGLAAAMAVLEKHEPHGMVGRNDYRLSDTCRTLRAIGAKLLLRLREVLEGTPIDVVGNPQHFKFVPRDSASDSAHRDLMLFCNLCWMFNDIRRGELGVLIHKDANNANLAMNDGVIDNICEIITRASSIVSNSNYE